MSVTFEQVTELVGKLNDEYIKECTGVFSCNTDDHEIWINWPEYTTWVSGECEQEIEDIEKEIRKRMKYFYEVKQKGE